MSTRWAMRSQAVSLYQKNKKKTGYFIYVQFLKRICGATSVLFTRDTKRNIFAANGIAVCTWKHNKSNADGDVPHHVESDKEIFANGALLSFPVMRHEYNRRELIERSPLYFHQEFYIVPLKSCDLGIGHCSRFY